MTARDKAFETDVLKYYDTIPEILIVYHSQLVKGKLPFLDPKKYNVTYLTSASRMAYVNVAGIFENIG